ncbi:MAG: nitroreductase family protein [Muribaculaceae bacterium]|nr:nitroreductase family protein [Muribaculaceae bacterium]
MEQTIKGYFPNRRTVRKFSDRKLDDATIDEIISLATKAPTTGNMQLYTVIVNRDPEMLARLQPMHFNQPASVGAKALLTVCADFNRFSRWCRLSDADPGYDNFLSFTSAMLDATILAQQIVTIAEMKGLGTCYLGTVTYNAAGISEILNLPELVVPVACIAIGWSDDDGEESERLPIEAVRSYEQYPDFSDDEIIQLFKAKDDYAPNAKFVAENGKKTLAQVFTDVRYPRGMNEEFSARFIELLKDKKFL